MLVELFSLLCACVHFSSADNVYEGLMSLYNATGGNHQPASLWIHNKNWGSALHYCKWEGIYCDSTYHFALNQSAGGLVGTIPTGIAFLGSYVTSLRLHRNQLSGSIPTQIGVLTGLMELDVQENIISGTLPTTLSKLGKLDMFWIVGNQIGGILDPVLAPVLSNCAKNQPVGCRMSGNPFKCPVPGWVPVQCGVGCIN
eukprot:TRINITY_DN14180_c0_g1_i1.p1 TRINITY_DN14180_c0_g1~~TRINITY_DN14180_c0_g1_i1.p1  ORF type:complete len:199 (-),score=25.74 TRINITY_DN14180_c0_g1_i1:105-701(-)